MRHAVLLMLLAAACADERRVPAAPTLGQAAPGLSPAIAGAAPTEATVVDDGPDLPPGHPPMPGQMEDAEPDEADVPNPHSGLAAGPADPTRVVTGRIVVAPALAERTKPGDAIFLTLYPLDAEGRRIQRILAVDRVDLAADGTALFRITAAQALDAAAAFTGPVELVARLDRDGEVRSRDHGDLEGTTRARIPQTNVAIQITEVVR